MNVLVTGLSGLVGSALKPSIIDKYQLTALNRSVVADVPTVQASLDDAEAIRPAFEKQDLVVHMAAKIDDSFGWEALHETNVIGTRNVFEAAATAGVKRVVFISSGATVAGWERVEPYKSIVQGRYDQLPDGLKLIDESMATRPMNLYASTKVWGEALGRFYSDANGMEVVCLRIGFAHEADRAENARHKSVWNSLRDVSQAIELAMSVDLQDRFDTFFILSNNSLAYRDISRARERLGFNPQDSA